MQADISELSRKFQLMEVGHKKGPFEEIVKNRSKNIMTNNFGTQSWGHTQRGAPAPEPWRRQNARQKRQIPGAVPGLRPVSNDPEKAEIIDLVSRDLDREEAQEDEKRRANVVVSGIQEAPQFVEGIDRDAEDAAKIEDLIISMGLDDEDIKIKKVFRLGKQETQDRQMLIKFQDAKAKNLFTSASKNLRDIPEKGVRFW